MCESWREKIREVNNYEAVKYSTLSPSEKSTIEHKGTNLGFNLSIIGFQSVINTSSDVANIVHGCI